MSYPRPGGEADKICNRYEALWTIQALLDVNRGRARWIELESLDRNSGKGAEFTLVKGDGTPQFHSVKRQRSPHSWTIAALTTPKSGKTAPLTELIEKLRRNSATEAVFVTAVPGGDAHALFECFRVSDSPADLKSRIDQGNKEVRKQFERRLLQEVFDDDLLVCFAVLRRMDFKSMGHVELDEEVERQISDYFYHANGTDLIPVDVKEVLAGFILDNLGRRLFRAAITEIWLFRLCDEML